MLCSACITASECPSGHKQKSSDIEVLRKRFEGWTKRHGRIYKHSDEWEVRFSIYQANVQYIECKNAQKNSYNLTDNKFADLTNEEFRSTYMGLRTRSHSRTGFSYDEHGDLPESKDWRKEGAVTKVKNQGRCGNVSCKYKCIAFRCFEMLFQFHHIMQFILCLHAGGCWAFSAVAAIEGLHKIKSGKLVSLSEQELIDCDVESDNQGCQGGLMETAFTFIINNGGITTEKDYPYQGVDGTCDTEKTEHYAVSISGYEKVPADNEAKLKAAAAHQPISVGIDAGGYSFQLYSEGVFSGICGRQLNHAVTVVGYGEENRDKYWIVKNSWGSEWGESGYIRMKRDTFNKAGLCGIAKLASYPV